MIKKLFFSLLIGVLTILQINQVIAVEQLNIGGAQQITVTTPRLNTGPDLVATIIRVLTAISVILFVVLIVVGGIQYLGSFGNEEATTKARKLILDAVIGLFIVLSVFGIAAFVLGQFGVNTINTLDQYFNVNLR